MFAADCPAVIVQTKLFSWYWSLHYIADFMFNSYPIWNIDRYLFEQRIEAVFEGTI